MHAYKLTAHKSIQQLIVMATLLLVGSSLVVAQQAPPQLGQETKGTPAVDETTPAREAAKTTSSNQTNASENEDPASGIDSLLGTAEITESKRESGQIYLIELEHSSGSKQYIEEIDSDGKIESTSNDIEETPNLPKWKLGSW